jgi:hypothetical protein
MKLAIRIPTLLALAAASGCGDARSSSSDGFAVTDSAGVEIVTNGATGAWGEARLTGTEELRIGSVDGPAETQFFRVGPIALAEDGTLHVADNGEGEIRVFAPDGAWQRTLGGQGDGPGEFRFITGLVLTDDGIVALDGQHRRATVLADDGSVVDSWMLEEGGRGVSPLAELDSGWIAVVFDRSSGWRYEVGVGRQDTTRIAWLADGRPSGEVREIARYARGRYFGIRSERVMTANSPIWEPDPAHAVDGLGRTYVHHGLPYVVDVYDASGTLVRSIRRAHEPVPVTDALVGRYADAARAFFDTATAEHSEWDITRSAELGRLDLPRVKSVPALGRMLVSREGALWLERPDLAADPLLLEWSRGGRQPSIWDVFSADGEFMGTVELPGTFTPRVVTPTHVIGILRDDLDLQHVTRLRVGPEEL